jgi:hypothetical protein
MHLVPTIVALDHQTTHRHKNPLAWNFSSRSDSIFKIEKKALFHCACQTYCSVNALNFHGWKQGTVFPPRSNQEERARSLIVVSCCFGSREWTNYCFTMMIEPAREIGMVCIETWLLVRPYSKHCKPQESEQESFSLLVAVISKLEDLLKKKASQTHE